MNSSAFIKTLSISILLLCTIHSSEQGAKNNQPPLSWPRQALPEFRGEGRAQMCAHTPPARRSLPVDTPWKLQRLRARWTPDEQLRVRRQRVCAKDTLLSGSGYLTANGRKPPVVWRATPVLCFPGGISHRKFWTEQHHSRRLTGFSVTTSFRV